MVNPVEERIAVTPHVFSGGVNHFSCDSMESMETYGNCDRHSYSFKIRKSERFPNFFVVRYLLLYKTQTICIFITRYNAYCLHYL